MKRVLPALLILQFAAVSGVLGWIVTHRDGPGPPAAGVDPAPRSGRAHGARGAPPPPADAGHASPSPVATAPSGPDAAHATPAAVVGQVPQAAPGADPHAVAPSARTPAQVLEALAAGNRRFAAGERRERATLAERMVLAAGQHPGAIVLSCSDSRVPPELVFDQSLGDLFVVRTAGNVADAIALGSIEYAAEHLHVGVLIVLGHEKCGAVTAATQDVVAQSPNLGAVLGAIAPAVKPLQAQASGAELVHRGVEANVEASLAHVLEASPLLMELLQRKQLVAKRAVYDLETGEVRLW